MDNSFDSQKLFFPFDPSTQFNTIKHRVFHSVYDDFIRSLVWVIEWQTCIHSWLGNWIHRAFLFSYCQFKSQILLKDMEFFSNRQNKPSSRDKSFSSGKTSGSDCASQKKKKLIAEKLAIRFLINKKILTKNKYEAADRSIDWVQGTPNPKISSAPKPVRIAAVIRAEGDVDAQEQPEIE